MYLTDVVKLAAQDGIEIASVVCENASEVAGVNDKMQLMNLERTYQQQTIRCLMDKGLCVKDAARLDIRGDLIAGKDCSVDVNMSVTRNVFENNTAVLLTLHHPYVAIHENIFEYSENRHTISVEISRDSTLSDYRDFVVNASHNYWGTDDVSLITRSIHDNDDNFQLMKVKF